MMTDPIVPVPEWARRPNRYQRHWIRYSFIAIISSSVLKFLYKHSPLSGSDAMYRWLQSAKFALNAHIVDPLMNLAGEVFDMFHGYPPPRPSTQKLILAVEARSPGIVSREDYEQSKDSLLRMLKDFKEDNAEGTKSDTVCL